MSDSEIPPPPASDDAGTSAPPPPPPPPGQRPLLRRDTGRHAAGVAGGLADYLGVDALVLRIGFVVLALFGVGLPLYLVGWVAMPSPSRPQSYLEQWFGSAPNPAVLVAIAVAVIVVFASIDEHDGDGVGWGLALLFGGWLLFRADSRTASDPATVYGPAAPPPPGGTWHGRGGSAEAAPAQPWTPPPPRPRSILGRLTVGSALAAVGVAAVFQQTDVLTLEPEQYVALALTIVGAGLIAGAWVGRAYGLIAVGLLLLPVMFIASLPPVPFGSGAGEAAYAPQTVDAIDDRYVLGAGRMVLDLRGVDFSGETVTTTVSVSVGETIVTVPDDVTVAVTAGIRGGDIDLFGTALRPEAFSDPIKAVDEGSGSGRLDLVIDNGFGELVVRRASQDTE